jgi:hypothetical protein
MGELAVHDRRRAARTKGVQCFEAALHIANDAELTLNVQELRAGALDPRADVVGA